jgi:WXXGXW repeat (2 copies)
MRFTFFIRSLMFAFALLAISGATSAQLRVAITIAPPPLVVYEQPICPGDGYIWTPGFWSYDYDASDYFWVPGTWVLAPEVGFFWTPGYWGWGDNAFLWYDGYWGPEIGFYGGINYGFGYFGTGYVGGRWNDGHFFYNTTINNVNVNVIHNVYNTRVEETTVTRVSFNGGNGGINARPSAREETYAHESHTPRVAAQNEHIQAARSDPQQRFSTNHGAPAVAATPKPGAFKEGGVVRARNDAEANRPNERPENNNGARPNPMHPNDLPALEHPPAPNTGNPKTDKKYQQQQEKLMTKQQQDRQKLQQQQDQEHQRLAKQNADDSRKQQVEQKHSQQTQQMQQKHTQQQQQLQQRQAPPASRPQSAPPKPH